MTKYLLSEAVIGTAAELPKASDPKAGASSVPTALYIETDTGAIKLSTGQGWITVGQLPAGGGGAITDATTAAIGGVEVDHARSGAHSVALTTDGVALPAAMLGTGATQAMPGNAYPDVTSDRLTPGGLVVAGNVEAASYSGSPMCRLSSNNTSGAVVSGARLRIGWAPPHQIGTSFSAVADGGFGYPAIQVAEAGTYAVLWMIQIEPVAAGLVAVDTFDQNGNQTEVAESDFWPQTTGAIVQLTGSEIWVVSAPPGDLTLELHNQTTDDLGLNGAGGAQMYIYKISGDSLPF